MLSRQLFRLSCLAPQSPPLSLHCRLSAGCRLQCKLPLLVSWPPWRTAKLFASSCLRQLSYSTWEAQPAGIREASDNVWPALLTQALLAFHPAVTLPAPARANSAKHKPRGACPPHSSNPTRSAGRELRARGALHATWSVTPIGTRSAASHAE